LNVKLHPLIERKGYKTLLVIDRATGETERIPLTDGNAVASVASAAESCGLTDWQAWCLLAEGQELGTAGYLRRLAQT
jgi:hypothetical protein